MKEIRQKELDDLVRKIARLEPIEFLGLATIFGVKIGEECTQREVGKIVEGIVNKYASLSREKRREIQKILEAATRRSRKNGN